MKLKLQDEFAIHLHFIKFSFFTDRLGGTKTAKFDYVAFVFQPPYHPTLYCRNFLSKTQPEQAATWEL